MFDGIVKAVKCDSREPNGKSVAVLSKIHFFRVLRIRRRERLSYPRPTVSYGFLSTVGFGNW